MNDTFFAYLQQLELIAFFSGYPLIYTLVVSIVGKNQPKSSFKSNLVPLLPFAYALVGTLYLGLQLKNLFPDYSIDNIILTFQGSYLKIWGILSLLFWIRAFNKKTIFSLLHSLIFFFLLSKNIFLYLFNTSEQINIRNEMKVYTDSLLLNIGSLAAMSIIHLIVMRYRKNRNRKD